MAKSGKRKRSQAAKKGWATRRANAERNTFRKMADRADKRDPVSRLVTKEAIRSLLTDAGIKVPKRISYERIRNLWQDFLGNRELERRELQTARQREALESAARSRAEAEVIKAHSLLPLIANRAIKETVARLHELGNEPPEGWVQDEYLLIRSRMSMAAEVGDTMEEADRLAQEYEYTPREIFTIWLSP